MKYILFVLLFVTIYMDCFSQKRDTCILNKFVWQKDSIISEHLKSDIDTVSYRCIYQESSGVYLYLSNGKCFVYCNGVVDSLRDRQMFDCSLLSELIDENELNGLLDKYDGEYSFYGSFFYFEKFNSGKLYCFNSTFARFINFAKTEAFGRGVFDLLGLAKLKLGKNR